MPKQNMGSLISPDDFSADQPMMVLRSRMNKVCTTPDGPEQIALEDPLSRVVLEIKAINLPFVLVSGSCPIRGQQNLLVDVRMYDFIKVSRAFADAVTETLQVPGECPAAQNDQEEFCELS